MRLGWADHAAFAGGPLHGHEDGLHVSHGHLFGELPDDPFGHGQAGPCRCDMQRSAGPELLEDGRPYQGVRTYGLGPVALDGRDGPCHVHQPAAWSAGSHKYCFTTTLVGTLAPQVTQNKGLGGDNGPGQGQR